jgi:putative acetyltransferase
MPIPATEPEFSPVIGPRSVRGLKFRPFRPGDEEAFRTLNEQWIAKYFHMEDKDREILCDPVGKILKHRGHIFLGELEGEAVATCALVAMQAGEYEVAKMAVDERHRGTGIGRALLGYTIGKAAELGAYRLYLETNSSLASAIHLYEAAGFRHLPPERVTPSPYQRADVFMEMLL